MRVDWRRIYNELVVGKQMEAQWRGVEEFETDMENCECCCEEVMEG